MESVKSPCINYCVLSKDKICMGCFRTIEEIKNWSKMTNEEKTNVLKRIKNA